jgi:hypothetical protein
VLTEHVRSVRYGHSNDVPVVELDLTDGYRPDLCHVSIIEEQWMTAQAYRDKEPCKEMDLMFVPYALVTRVSVSMWHRSQRLTGFVLDHAPADRER